MNAQAQMLSELRCRQHGRTLPRKFYTDLDYHQLDLQALWYREWLFAGHDCELAEPGAYFTLQVGEYPILVVRSNDGVIRAFHNSCRHRGSRICAAERGTVSKLRCPYHSWMYGLDGRLLHARDMGADFSKDERGLKSVRCESLGGYIFICLAKQAPDLAAFRARMEPYLAPHRLGEAKVAFSSTIVENGNWKLVWENNRECYHCSANHPELCRTYPETPTLTGPSMAMSDPIVREHAERCEAAGLPSRFDISPDGQHRLARRPLLEGAVSYTMNGEPAVQRSLSNVVTEPNIGALLMFHYPSTWNHILRDHAISFRVAPIGPRETALTTKWLVNKDAVEGVDYTLDELTKVWLATNDQDRRIVEENQIGVSSPAFEPGPYSPVHEAGVIQFVEWYACFVERALGGEGAKLRSIA
jgi:Rieske 2Fe-2S family protein